VKSMWTVFRLVGIFPPFLGQHLDMPDPRNPNALPFLINTHFTYQSGIPNSVVIIYDHLASTHGTLSLKALRLTKTFMEMYKNKEKSFTKERLSGFTFRDIFEEVPIRLSTTGLATALLYHLETDDSLSDQYESLDLAADDFFEKNLEILQSSLADLQMRQNVYQQWLKNVDRAEKSQQQFLQKRVSFLFLKVNFINFIPERGECGTRTSEPPTTSRNSKRIRNRKSTTLQKDTRTLESCIGVTPHFTPYNGTVPTNFSICRTDTFKTIHSKSTQ